MQDWRNKAGGRFSGRLRLSVLVDPVGRMRQSLLPLLVFVLTVSCRVEEEPPRTLKEVRDKLDRILLRDPSSVIESSSPLGVTHLVESVSETIEAELLVEVHANKIFHDFKDRTPYEIQEYCMVHVRSDKSLGNTYEVAKFQDCA